MNEHNPHKTDSPFPGLKEIRHLKPLLRFAGLAVGIALVVFLLPRLMPVSVSMLEPVGFYMGGDNASEWASLPVNYNQNNCSACHTPSAAVLTSGGHATLNCQTCHAQANDHPFPLLKLPVEEPRESCLSCHAGVAGRPASFPHVDATHAAGSCSSCHNPHSPRPVTLWQGQEGLTR